ncbi:2'-5' RNA ligase family protein [Nocardioides pantholopis]|uniref:2'-5' RNA ligase family protein n=1 Tax=Nocardioides pantholopis TaxID=2483798 RepID=UPI000FDB30AE|nr:2'-5' RNA ligase family protein [Nocardioides pantholopis]
MSWPGHPVLQVPVPPLEPFVRARTAHYDAAYLSAEPCHVHAHVTALGPFLADPDEEDLALVAKVAASVEPFDFVLDRLATFPDGIIHLAPEPDAPFRELTRRLVEAFPQCPPYGGAFGRVEDVVPHLTLDAASNAPGAAVTQASTRRLLGDLVPARCRAERLDLAWYEPHRCRVLASWPLGG